MWLAVLENGGHAPSESSVLQIELKDITINETLLFHRYDAGGGVDIRFLQNSSLGASFYYTPSWQVEHLTINESQLGHSFELSVLAADCKYAGHRGYAYIDVFGGVLPNPN